MDATKRSIAIFILFVILLIPSVIYSQFIVDYSVIDSTGNTYYIIGVAKNIYNTGNKITIFGHGFTILNTIIGKSNFTILNINGIGLEVDSKYLYRYRINKQFNVIYDDKKKIQIPVTIGRDQ